MKERVAEHCPNIDNIKMQHAVYTFLNEGFHADVDFVVEAKNGAKILRYNQGDIVTYPVVDAECRAIVTVYTQEYVKSLKKRTKFKKLIRSRKYWRGKT